MKTFKTLLLFLFASAALYGQIDDAAFDLALNEGDTTTMQQLIAEWSVQYPGHPKLAIIQSEYYYQFAIKEKQMIDVMLAEPNDSLSYAQYKMKSEEINEIKQEWNYYMQKSIDALNVGLYQYPYHFDLRIWKLILLNNWEHYDEFVSLIAETYDMKLENKEPFVWNIEESLDDKDVDFFYAMQRFQSCILDEELFANFPQMLNINQKLVKAYPKYNVPYVNIGLIYTLQNNYKDGIKWFQKSEKIDPTDITTLRNLAGTYDLMKNEKKTLEYLQKIIKHGNTEQRKEARELIEMVKNKYKE